MHSSTIYTARTIDLVVEDVGQEVLVYDKRTDVAHCLTAVAAQVWRRCENGAGLDELVQAITDDASDADAEQLVLAALGELSEKDLLETVAGVSRRQAVRRLAGMGMAAAAVPMVVSAAVTSPAMATSSGTFPQGHTCTADNQCSGTLVCSTNGFCYTSKTNCLVAGSMPPGGGCNQNATKQALCCSNTCSTTSPTVCA